MWTCKAFDPKNNKTCNTSNPDDVAACARCGAPRPSKTATKAVGARWLVILPIVALILAMILPLIFSLALRLDFRASLERGDNERGPESLLTQDQDSGYFSYGIGSPVDLDDDENDDPEAHGRGLVGAITEKLTVTQTTEYESEFVPIRLATYKGSMVWIGILYGPSFITGAPLELIVAPGDSTSDLDGIVSMHMSNTWVPVLFAVVYLVFLFIVNVSLKDPKALLKFAIAFTLTWLIYSAVLWALGGVITSGATGLFNSLLTEEQSPASYSLVQWGFLSAPIRIFLLGKIFWVLSSLLKRAKAGGTQTGTRP